MSEQTSKQIDPNTKFEDAMSELEQIVSKLETGQAPLEESIELYERGVILRKHCEQKLKSAQSRIDKITGQDENGEITTQPLDAD